MDNYIEDKKFAVAYERFKHGLILRMVSREEYEKLDWGGWRESFRPIHPTDDQMLSRVFNPTEIKKQYDDGAEKIFYLDMLNDEEIKRRMCVVHQITSCICRAI